MTTMRRFLNEEEGAQTVEYALVLGLVVLAVVTGMSSVGGAISALWGRNDAALNSSLVLP